MLFVQVKGCRIRGEVFRGSGIGVLGCGSGLGFQGTVSGLWFQCYS